MAKAKKHIEVDGVDSVEEVEFDGCTLPVNFVSISIDGIEYVADEDGNVTVPAELVDIIKSHG